MSTNTVTISGNLAADPELRFTPQGKAVAKFSVAVNKRVNRDGEWADELEGFFNVECWGKFAEALANVTKGTAVFVTGRLKQDTWEDKETGAKRSAVKVVAEDGGVSLKFGNKAEKVSAGTWGDDGGF